MRIRLEYSRRLCDEDTMESGGTVFEYESRPMPEHRFKALCLLAAGGLYVGLVAAVAALCGGFGVLMVAAVTLFVVMIASA